MTGARVLLVAAGGTIGTAARLALGLWLPVDGMPWATLLVNVLGAALLGILTARLPAPDLRLFLGTGALGGFTTYSALTVGTLELWQTAPVLAATYAGGSVVLGVTAAALGLRLGRPRSAGA